MKLLIVEDEKHIRQGIVDMLLLEGFDVYEADSVAQALNRLHDESIDAVLCDHHLPDGESFDVLLALSGEHAIPLIMMTAFGNRALVSKAFTAGVYDYVSKPIRFDELLARLGRLEEKILLRHRIRESEKEFQDRGELAILGASTAMKQVQHFIEKVGASQVPILLQGETGVGKGMVARLLHSRSAMKDQPFVRVNCAAIPQELLESELFGHKKGAFSGADQHRQGLLASAGKGTIFLDELVELPLNMQSKLLHVLDERTFRPVGDDKEYTFHARVIAASNYNFEQAVKDGKFREDLYFRLNVMQLLIPPLRERTDDIVALAHRLLSQTCSEWGRNTPELTPEQCVWLESQAWRGNVRELRNVLERSLLLGTEGELALAHEQDIQVSASLSLSDACHDFETRYIQQVIHKTSGDKSKAAQILGIGLSTLYRKLDG